MFTCLIRRILVGVYFTSILSVASSHASLTADRWAKIAEGRHSLQKLPANPFYKLVAVKRRDGKVVLFNFDLAKKMGLVDIDSPNHLTPEIIERVLSSTSLRVVPTSEGPQETRIATYYQDGGLDYDSGKGDGRSLWISEVEMPDMTGKNQTTYLCQGNRRDWPRL